MRDAARKRPDRRQQLDRRVSAVPSDAAEGLAHLDRSHPYLEQFSAGRKLALVAEIAVAYLRARVLLRTRGTATALSTIRERYGTRNSGFTAAGELAMGYRLAWVVVRVLRALPDSRCLIRSIVLVEMLARRGVTSSLVIGVSPGPDFGAHAWVELDSAPLLPPDEWRYARMTEL